MSETSAQFAMGNFRTRRPTSMKPKKQETAARIAKIVGESLRDIRRRQGHSLDSLALASGVSRAMLGQIETGKSIPTITVLWKVAEALRVPVAQLISDPEEPPYIITRGSEARTTTACSGRYETRLIADSDDPPGVTFEQIRIAPGHSEVIAERRGPARASLVVAEGSIEIAFGDEAPAALGKGDAIFYSVAVRHMLSNSGDNDAVLYLVVTPQRNGR